jgi:glycosyltransferase involved in cell wall biosynthesis
MQSMKDLCSYRFSIVVPCYNEADYIEATLDSLKQQKTKASYEVIIVDNNCTDNTVEIAKRYDEVRIVSEKVPGVCAARQAGLQQAAGEIVISTDADTIFNSDWLEKIDNVFKSNSNIVAVGGPCRYYDGPWWGKIYTHFLFGSSYLFCLVRGYPSYVTATNLAFKKEYFNGYDLNLIQGGDELGVLHQLRNEGSIVFSPKNTTYTSGRRLEKGLIYNIFVTFIYYYLAAYYINSIFHRQIIGSAPAFRRKAVIQRVPGYAVVLFLLIIVSFPAYMDAHKLTSFISENAKDIRILLKRDF